MSNSHPIFEGSNYLSHNSIFKEQQSVSTSKACFRLSNPQAHSPSPQPISRTGDDKIALPSSLASAWRLKNNVSCDLYPSRSPHPVNWFFARILPCNPDQPTSACFPHRPFQNHPLKRGEKLLAFNPAATPFFKNLFPA